MHELIPEILTTALDDGLGRVRREVGAIGERDREIRVVERGVAEAEAELVARRDVLGVEGAVVDVDALVEGRLRELRVDAVGPRRVLQGSEVGLVARHRVRQLARRVDVAVEQRDQRPPRVLPGEVGEDEGCDVGVVDELVHEPHPGVVEYHDGVAAARCHVRDQRVREVVVQPLSIQALGRKGVPDDDARVGGLVDLRIAAVEVPP